ncbi:MAG TPA: sigma-70 family RNA polymerase sigma factor [Planctomycetota bacterium]|jgi:RNA polymerase sigma-70 factor (ECF subfamily)|nr:sigma-70 family RNA polymerase sigma factor [Planctomycetota bacterium]
MDSEGVVRLLTRERLMIQAFIRALVPDPHLAEDVFQEVFIVALRKHAEFREGSDFGAWVREIARRVSWAELRKTGRRPLALAPETLESVGVLLEQEPEAWEEHRGALKECVGLLPAESRRILTLRYLENAPLASIAAAVGRSTDGVKGVLKRLRQRLAECVSGRLREGLSGGAV